MRETLSKMQGLEPRKHWNSWVTVQKRLKRWQVETSGNTWTPVETHPKHLKQSAENSISSDLRRYRGIDLLWSRKTVDSLKQTWRAGKMDENGPLINIWINIYQYQHLNHWYSTYFPTSNPHSLGFSSMILAIASWLASARPRPSGVVSGVAGGRWSRSAAKLGEVAPGTERRTQGATEERMSMCYMRERERDSWNVILL